MKKIACLLVMALFISIVFSIALSEEEFLTLNEDFVLRNGIKFNSTLDDIKEVEEKNDTFKLTENQSDDDTYGLFYEGTVAGEVGSGLRYVIRKSDDRLSEISYRIGGGGYSRDRAEELYKRTLADLKELYGEPMYSDLISVRPFIELNIPSPSDGSYSQWVVEYNDCYVIMSLTSQEMILGFPGMPQKSLGHYVNIHYHLFSKEEMEELIKTKESEREEKKSAF